MDAIDRVKKLLKDNKVSQKKLAASTNIFTSTLSDILNRKGRYFSPQNIKDIADFFNTTADHILGIEDEKQKVRVIPLIGLASCGIPQEYDLNGYDPIPISEEIYEDGMYAVQAEGNSMSPKINDRAIVYCNVNRHIDNGNIVHYWLNGESGIKRYKMNERGDVITLVPLNSDYDVITIHADDNVELKMARVVGVVDLDF
ncbi:MAG: LexA family transcriptional regulator [Campylobacterales bacterium]|nr:LexA family transcriptional regulator [Campylobacterales bacterium]